MALPLLAGAVKLTLAPVAPDLVADILVGVPGTVQAGAITVHRINTMPLNAKITANKN